VQGGSRTGQASAASASAISAETDSARASRWRSIQQLHGGQPVQRHDLVYGEDIVYTGPTYDSMKVEGNKVLITFKDTGSGLAIGTPPWTPSGKIPPVASELKGFAIAGADKKWVWAQARINGDQVVVSSDQASNPAAVRYGWADNPPCNLYNKEKLPAAPFRTDDWEPNLPPRTARN